MGWRQPALSLAGELGRGEHRVFRNIVDAQPSFGTQLACSPSSRFRSVGIVLTRHLGPKIGLVTCYAPY